MGTANGGTITGNMIVEIEAAKREAEGLKARIADVAALDPVQAQIALSVLQDMQEWLHELWMAEMDGNGLGGGPG